MFLNLFRREVVVGLLVGIVGMSAQGRAATPTERFHEAYYLENAKADFAAAAKIYAEITEDAKAEAQVRSDAAARLSVCREELASRDMASLMPPEALVYFELKNPGDRLNGMLTQLGLVANGQAAVKGAAQRVAISPVLMKELFGLRGAAVAVTGFDPMSQTPKGVAVLNAGDLEVIRAMIESALPSTSVGVEPIGGFPTYQVEGKAWVTLTSRLVIASSDRPQIEAVIRRIQGKEKGSLATNTTFTTAVGSRDDALLVFMVNTKSLMPIAKGLLTLSGETAQQFSLADALLDLEHLSAVAGKVAVSEAGLGLDLSMQLDEGHQNLVFNLLRRPGISRETLKAVPDGAALFLVTALNDPLPRATPGQAGTKPPIVTLLDYGREIFANITTLALFVLPPSASADASASTGGAFPIPDIGVVITVNDPAKSQALWTQTLGLASLATGAAGMEGAKIEVEGAEVRTYAFQGGPTVHFATSGNDVVVGSSRAAIARSLQAKKTGKSVLTDAAFAPTIAKLNANTAKLTAVHAARAVEISKQFMPPAEFQEIAPYVGVLTDTTASLSVEHSNTLLRFSLSLTGLPDVSGVVVHVMAEERRQEESREELSGLRKEFDKLATQKKDDDALKVGQQIFERTKDDAKGLNNLAWALLTEERYGLRFNQLALSLSVRSNELSKHESWVFLDTLALAKFETGDVEGAIELEKKAIALAGDRNRADLRTALTRFEAARDKSRSASSKSGTD